ncbi:MAG TPA: hypothetical protein DEF35_04435 [Paenibacillus sp.]|uniref:hypothetical protein n=1 Tax=Paenibacillus TaxID=44249 RepID=UPI000BA15116|nr:MULTISPECIES: hypothetical protein [Paenibacillus]OZQ60773.1 hypothetical protein CA599_29460 [Paenibacillus taichungensis]HBU80875.1 hypothetical protein [Paenibacillus sp.]
MNTHHSDIETVNKTLALIEQILTYISPQDWTFTARFPEQFKEFRMAAGRLSRSKNRKVKAYGRALVEYDRCLADFDKGFTQAKAAKAAKIGERVVAAMKEVPEHVV